MLGGKEGNGGPNNATVFRCSASHIIEHWIALSPLKSEVTPFSYSSFLSGVLGEPGSSAFLFYQKAIIEISTDSNNSFSSSGNTIDPTELAIEVGAEDVQVSSDPETGARDSIQLKCEPSQLNAVCGAVREKGLEIASAGVMYLPRSSVSLSVEQFEKAEKMVDLLSDQSDVVAVYSNHELA